MKQWMFGLFLILTFSFYGCLVRTYTVDKPRVDLEVNGNQGYLKGTSNESRMPKNKLSSNRKISVFEVELGRHNLHKGGQEKIKGNNISKTDENLSEQIVLKEPEESSENKPLLEQANKPKKNEKEYKLYTVKKNDTLQKISKKFYNTTRRWIKIYQANKDILKSPDKLYAGQVLKIPQE